MVVQFGFKVTSGFLIFHHIELGLYSQPMDPTHLPLPTEPDLPPTEPTSSTIGDGLLPPKPDFDGSNVGSPSSKSEKPDPTDPQIFRHNLINPMSFEMFFS